MTTKTISQAEFTKETTFGKVAVGESFAFAPQYVDTRTGRHEGTSVARATVLGVFTKTSARKYIGDDGVERTTLVATRVKTEAK